MQEELVDFARRQMHAVTTCAPTDHRRGARTRRPDCVPECAATVLHGSAGDADEAAHVGERAPPTGAGRAALERARRRSASSILASDRAPPRRRSPRRRRRRIAPSGDRRSPSPASSARASSSTRRPSTRIVSAAVVAREPPAFAGPAPARRHPVHEHERARAVDVELLTLPVARARETHDRIGPHDQLGGRADGRGQLEGCRPVRAIDFRGGLRRQERRARRPRRARTWRRGRRRAARRRRKPCRSRPRVRDCAASAAAAGWWRRRA